MGRVSIIKAYCFALVIGLISGEIFNCAMENSYCSPPDTAITVELSVKGMGQDAQDECYTACFNDKAGTPPCQGFTLKQIGSRLTMCYLLYSKCDIDTDDVCLATGKCLSGPADCSAPPVTTCPGVAVFEADAANWLCTDEMGDVISLTGDDVAIGTSCTQTCPAWRSDAGVEAPVVMVSTCEEPGEWSVPKNLDNEAVTIPEDSNDFKKPNEKPIIQCGCGNLELTWPDGNGGVIHYNPNDEDGTDFICNTPLLETTEGSKDWYIDKDNTCKLFCDGHYVATAQCFDGFWTGNPEWGFWCYTEPSA